MKKRLLAILLAVCLLIGILPVASAAETGGAQGVVDAAKSYLEKAVGPDFGGGETDWCGRFLYRCAEDAGESAALCGSVETMKSTNRAMEWFVENGCAGGYFYEGVNYANYGMTKAYLTNKDNYTPALGDIIFYDWDGNPSNFGHMELVTGISGRTITTIGGSTGGSCTKKDWDGRYHVHAHTYDISNKFIVGYVRPNYGGSSTLGISPLVITPTTEPSEHMKQGNPFYFRGSITSGASITSATVSILGADGATVIQTKTVYPNSTTVDILKDGLDSLKFGSLSVGGYYLCLTAADAAGQTAEWIRPFSIGNASLPSQVPDGSATKTQYRYHRYRDAAGNVSLCPYYGGDLYKSKMTLEYTDWLDQPLTKNSASGGHTHVNQGVWCTKAGCIDPSCKTDRFTDGSSNWYYEETRIVTAGPQTDSGDKEEGKSFTSKLPLPAIKTYQQGMFKDMSTNDWFYPNVITAYELGFMEGMNAVTFSPNTELTIAQAITMAARVHCRYHTGSMDFPVYDGGNWYDPFVDYALANAIIENNSFTRSEYDRSATREEFVYIMAHALPESELQAVTRVSFADEGKIYYRASVQLFGNAGIIDGYTQNGLSYFDPAGHITRAQAAAIVGRMTQPDTRINK